MDLGGHERTRDPSLAGVAKEHGGTATTLFGGRHMELAVEQRRVPEPVWESEEEFDEIFRREVVALRMLQHRRAEERDISSVPYALVSRIWPPVRLPSPVRPVPAPRTRPD